MPLAQSYKRLMVFADGENLVARYQKMLEEGYVPKRDAKIFHAKDVYVWSQAFSFSGTYAIWRSTYYASCVGDEACIDQHTSALREVRVLSENTPYAAHENPWYPKIFKKSKGVTRSKGVDIQLAVDVLSNVYQGNTEAVLICSGDGDYQPLLEECLRKGQRVLVAAFSSGLSEKLRKVADQLIILDGGYFEPK